jgi:hypothetical protein
MGNIFRKRERRRVPASDGNGKDSGIDGLHGNDGIKSGKTNPGALPDPAAGNGLQGTEEFAVK